MHRVRGEPTPAFAAFLDGTQESHVLVWSGAAPIVYGTVGAVIRERVDRRLRTWGRPRVLRRVYAPLCYAPRAALEEAFPPSVLVDTAPPAADGSLPPRHPALLLERAKSAVSRDRELLERELAESWCTTRDAPLLIDGGIAGNELVAQSSCAVGVIKSHRALYVSDRDVDTILSLRCGERSSVIRIAPRGRSAVHSWYLRLRDPIGHDALWGLVRVEVAEQGMDADVVSRWVLAERAPIAMPDGRWDKMSYGVWNCEGYLRAIR
ncbi:MAG: hypothetical protein IRY91_17690 [Gemmatimonadaceae bacterium]|nr:hypothetical protein [Gemmatimonadaceae bacterium]